MIKQHWKRLRPIAAIMVFKVFKQILVISIGLIAMQASAGVFYRYVNDEGHSVMHQTIPPQYVENGYDIVNDKGQVIERVPPKVTGAELKAREEAAQRAKEATAQEEYDLTLLRRYSFVTDLESERDRKIRELSVRVTILKSNLSGVRHELEQEYKKAARYERSGKEAPEMIQEHITQLEAKIANTESNIAQSRFAIEDERDEYNTAIERFKELQVLRGR